MSNIIVYEDGEISLNVSIDEETVWLNRKQLAELFDRDVKTIGKHINNVFKEKELEKAVVVAKFATTTAHGAIQGKTQTKNVEYYNLDVIISVGYRVKSQKGVRFRQWSTSVLKSYIQQGYAINTHKITEHRLSSLEQDVQQIKSHINDNRLTLTQGIFYNGQIFDAHQFVSDLIRKAKHKIILIDNYIDDNTLTLFHKNQMASVTIYTQSISKSLQLDIDKYNQQYNNLSVKTSKKFHDRFLIIDDETYLIGASLKDLGKKVFGFALIKDADLHLTLL